MTEVNCFNIASKEALMYTSIDIDFDVFKALTNRRATSETTENDVLRELLGLEPAEASNSGSALQPFIDSNPATSARLENNEFRTSTQSAWVWKGVSFPHGTEFRASYSGRYYYANVDDGAIVYNGKSYKSPSSAATAITNTSVNGWNFWECRLPGEKVWVSMRRMRNS
jgi:hypothetical protein